MEVTPRTHTNCTNEIPAEYNNTDVFIDPISFVIKAAAAPVRCNDIAPPRWRLNGRWYCAYPQIRDCSEPGRIPIKPINIDDVDVMNLRPRKEHLQPGAAGGVHALSRKPRNPTAQSAPTTAESEANGARD